ncbi:helix-turn-helix transcriptional regulator [Methanoplanus sp. FWC-SCC4]|uniref:Helix-turn-helix transcriptional regulator n=1 Tax=Methanochimaera problematica TaxID=2609417 RepID=A0AA97FCV8_9EURY|nr:helix-turn-helix domain-containing protein [Methanoplanus sp. FWC-SCC4]WOF15888.1 helix-turn-helix transcriptional regulator [Methanoplanus sp. FWC-SCC4]
MTDGVVLLEPGDERAKKIGKAMASQTVNEILALLKTGDLTLSEIAEQLNQPMTTVKYHVENVLDAGLIEVKHIKYSEKGREVKIYGLCDQVVIVSPGTKDLRSILLKYASLFSIFVLATVLVGAMSGTFFSGFIQTQDITVQDSVFEYASPEIIAYGLDNNSYETTPEMLKKISVVQASYNESRSTGGQYAKGDALLLSAKDKTTEAPYDAINIIVIAFFMGGCLVLLILGMYEAVIWRRERKYWESLNQKSEK